MTQNLIHELENLRAKRKLDLDLCHVRAAGMGAEIQRLEDRIRRSRLERIRDRLLLRYPLPHRRRLAKVLTVFRDVLAKSRNFFGNLYRV